MATSARWSHRGLIFGAWLVTMSSLAQAIPVADDGAGTREFSVNGCPANEAWTPAVVGMALGVPERVVRRANGRFAVSNLLLCTLPRPQVETVLARAAARKPGFDQPDRAIEYRIDSLRGDDGQVAPDGAQIAHEQRRKLAAKGWPKRAGLSPGQPFWTGLGPGTVGGRVRAILPLTPSRILIGSVSGGLWLTENAGAAWAPVRDLMPNVAISCLVADPLDASIVYVCTGEGAYPYDAIQGDGIYRITGADLPAASWAITRVPGTAPTGAGSPWYWVNRLVVLSNPADPANVALRVLVAATRNGLYRSADGGASFARVASETDVGFTYGHRYMDVRAHPLNQANLVAGEMFTSGAGGGVAASFDAGLTWARVALAGSERVEVTPVTGVAGRWLALAGNNGGQLFRSDNGGASWVRQDTSGLDNATPSLGGIMGSQAWYDEAVWASPDGTRVIAGGVAIRFSVDGGATFSKITSGTHSDHHAVVPATDNAATGTVYFGNDGGVYRATGVNALATASPGPVFASLNNGLAITQFYGGAGLGSFITGGTQDNGTKSFNGTSWFGTFGGDGGRSAIDPTNGSYVYGSTQNGGLFRSTDGGASANYICSGITEAGGCPGALTSGTLFVPPFTLDPNDPDRMLFGGQKLWRSVNVKAAPPAWAAIKGPQVSQLGSFNAVISTIAVRRGASDVVWIGYNDGQVWRTGNGTTATPAWERIVFNGVANPARQVLRILLDPNDANRAWVALGGYATGNVLVTANAQAAASAVSWTDVHGNLPAAPVRALVLHPQVPDALYAGTEVGVFASDTAGTTWSTQNEGPGTASVEDLFFTDPGTLIAATHGRGMFRASFVMPTAPGSVQFTQSSLAITEGGTASFTVTRVGGSAGAATASYAASGGTATSGVDYTATAGTLFWADGDASSRQISLPVRNDNLTEGVETFNLAITGTTGVSSGYPSSVAISIFDPDAFPPGRVTPTGWLRPTTSATNAGIDDWTIVQGWVVDGNPANAYEGMLSMRSGDMTGQNNRKAAMEAVVTTGAGNVTFATKVQSNECLHFYIDRVQAGGGCIGSFLISVGGVLMTGYGTVSFAVAAGTHTFRWQYERGAGAEVPPNAAWIDAVAFPPSGLEPVFTSAATANFVAGSAGMFTVSASGSPAPALSLAGTLPSGLEFTPETGVVAGTPAPGTEGSTTVAIEAANGRYPDLWQTLTIVVRPASCTYALVPTDMPGVPAAGGMRSIAVTAPDGCPVAAASHQSWVTVDAITPNGGTTIVALQVSPNVGPARATAIVAAGRLFLITQVAGP